MVIVRMDELRYNISVQAWQIAATPRVCPIAILPRPSRDKCPNDSGAMHME